MIRVNDVLYLGPDSLGKFTAVAIKSIHRKRMPVKEVRSGQTASFALKKVLRLNYPLIMIIITKLFRFSASFR